MADRGESIARAIRAALLTAQPRAKAMAARDVARGWRLGLLEPRFDVAMPDEPARPARPELLAPRDMPRRGRGSAHGRIAQWHALAHIEFVAIDLALDMAGRFGSEMGPDFVGDFLSVAADEAMHFALLDRKLRTMGSAYGALPAHDGLWSSAAATSHDVAARLAVVPMVLEARGLDVTPAMIERTQRQGDEHGARIMTRILNDEIRHVGIGTAHFVAEAERRGENAQNLWKCLVREHFNGVLKAPFNDSARHAAGLSQGFYGDLAQRT